MEVSDELFTACPAGLCPPEVLLSHNCCTGSRGCSTTSDGAAHLVTAKWEFALSKCSDLFPKITWGITFSCFYWFWPKGFIWDWKEREQLSVLKEKMILKLFTTELDSGMCRTGRGCRVRQTEPCSRWHLQVPSVPCTSPVTAHSNQWWCFSSECRSSCCSVWYWVRKAVK